MEKQSKTLENQKKLSDLELEKIQKVRQNNNEITNELGQIGVLEFQLEQRKKRAEERFHSYSKEEETLSQELMDRYGPGRIDLENGMYIQNTTQEES